MLPSETHTFHQNITKGLVTEVPFSWYTMSSYQEKISRHTNRQKTKQNKTNTTTPPAAKPEEIEQASKPDMSGMLESSDKEFKTTRFNIRAQMDKVESMQEQMGSATREMEIPRRNQKRNARNKKLCSRNEDCIQ